MTVGRELTRQITTTRALHHRARDLTDARFGRLLVTRPAGSDGRKTRWFATCDCGVEKTYVAAELAKGKTRSCGCLRLEAVRRPRTHGLSHHPGYHAFRSMWSRCTNPRHKAFHNYGGRGISVAESWTHFDAFWRDMGLTWAPGLTLDRTDNNGGYSAQNCRWVDMKTQTRNKRDNRTIDTPKGRMLLSEAAEVSGINVTTLAYRLGAGWRTERLFDPPDFANRWA